VIEPHVHPVVTCRARYQRLEEVGCIGSISTATAVCSLKKSLRPARAAGRRKSLWLRTLKGSVSIEYQRLKTLLRTSKIEIQRPRHTAGILGEIAGWAGRIVDVGSLKPRGK
jgi:hypothetical protein